MEFQEKSTVEILHLIMGNCEETGSELDAYLFAKKVGNAASVAMQLLLERATEQLIQKGGKGDNHFCKFSIQREFAKQFKENEARAAALDAVAAESTILKAAKEKLAEIEKEMEAAGLCEKVETGQTIRVSLLDKI